jgi:3-oxoacyl-[acyl-carrier protein] reductase
MDLYLKNKTAIVTGASQGIGRAIARTLASEGVKVFATARNEKSLDGLKEEVAASGAPHQLITYTQDLIAADSAANIAASALSQLGHVDILINNAGQSQPVDMVSDQAPWNQSMTLDFERPRQLTQALLPHMIARKQGAVLNLVSSYELRSLNVSAVAKGAITVWSKQLAAQAGQYGIRINCLQPGLIDTNNIRRFFSEEERREFARTEIPLGDFGTPEDMADMAVFLVSPRAKYITGSVFTVDGGMNRHAF